MSANFSRLQKEIISRSRSNRWNDAKLEWELKFIYKSNDETCLCGQKPISELCVLRNNENGNEAVVGNVCVKKFMDMDQADKIFQAFNGVAKGKTKALNEEAINYA
uniref:Uncharacterized protein n=1 Tax=Panagrolaimus sp. JU765 TaxID=591449 RepID=A0AC34RDV8_9BILA